MLEGQSVKAAPAVFKVYLVLGVEDRSACSLPPLSALLGHNDRLHAAAVQ